MASNDTLAKLAAGQRVTWTEAGFKAEAKIVRPHKHDANVWLIESASGVHWVDGSALTAQAPAAAEPDAPNFERMFMATCEALGSINEALGLDPDDGGAEPILDAIARLQETSPSAQYLFGHQDGLEWAAALVEANHPLTGDWMHDDRNDLAEAIRKGPELPVEWAQAAQQAAQAPEGWVSVEDRLPEINTEVLIAFDEIAIPSTGQYTGSAHDRNGWCYPSENAGCGKDFADPVVTHWQPLPDAPTALPQPPQPLSAQKGDA